MCDRVRHISVSKLAHKILKRSKSTVNEAILSMKHFEHAPNNVAQDFICSFFTALRTRTYNFCCYFCLFANMKTTNNHRALTNFEEHGKREQKTPPDWLNKRKISLYEIKKKEDDDVYRHSLRRNGSKEIFLQYMFAVRFPHSFTTYSIVKR